MNPQIQRETANKVYKNKFTPNNKAHRTETEEHQKQRKSLKTVEAVCQFHLSHIRCSVRGHPHNPRKGMLLHQCGEEQAIGTQGVASRT